MATYKVPYQNNLTFSIPSDGEVFTAVGDSQNSALYVRHGNKLYSIDLQSLGSQVVGKKITDAGLVKGQSYKMYDPNGATASNPSGMTKEYNAAIAAGLGGSINQNNSAATFNVGGNGNFDRTAGQQYLADQNLTVGGSYNLGDLSSTPFGTPERITGTDFSLFKSTAVHPEEVITQSVSASNPQGRDVTSSVTGSIEISPSLFDNLNKAKSENPGITDAQIQQLTQIGMANAGKPFTPEQIASVGYTPPPTQTTPPATTTPPANNNTPPTGSSTSVTKTPPTVNLQPGDTGENVKALQDYLVSQGLMTQAQVDTGYGTYGPQTTAAVKALQEKLGVDNSSGVGYYGPKTITAVGTGTTNNNNPVLSSPSSTTPVVADGYYSVNGAYFQKTGDKWNAVTDATVLDGLKTGKTPSKATSFSTLFGSTISSTNTDEETKFFASPEFNALTKDQQDAIRAVFGAVQTNDTQKKDLLQKAITKATENADPIFKQNLRMANDALDRGFTDTDNDLQFQEKQLTTALDRLKTDNAYNKNDLTIEQQNDLKQLEDNYTQQLGDTRQQLAAGGFTDSSRRASAEKILATTKGNLVESSNRQFAAKTRELDNATTRGAEDTATEIERLRELATSKKTALGRSTEATVGSANIHQDGYTPLGNIVGTEEQKRQKDIDATALDYYNLGFVV